MKVKSLDEIKEICDSVAEQTGVKVRSVEFKQGKNPALTVFLTKEGGMDLDSCEKFHNAINDPLDRLDPTFGEPYTLNVSSAGIDWAFETDEDFLSHIGKKVEVKLNVPIKGKKDLDGILEKYEKNKCVVIRVSEKLAFSIELKNVVKMNEFIDFE